MSELSTADTALVEMPAPIAYQVCGRPKIGPWVAWNAMNRVPAAMPSVPARIDQPSDRPSVGPTKPIGMVKYWKLPRNHSMLCCQFLPCRSGSGIQSIECTSICASSPLSSSSAVDWARDCAAISPPGGVRAGAQDRWLVAV